jgi:Zn-dependent proteases
MNDDIKIEIREENGVQIVEGIESTNKQKTKKKKGILATFAVAGAFLAKFKFLFIFLKLGKIFSTFGSMMLMIWVYARIHGWTFGVGFVLLLFMHEMGHYFAAKKARLPVSAPIFIPFVGAFISMKEQPADAKTEAFVAIGGPVLGSIAALLCLGIYYGTGKSVFLALAYSGFILNLFNLIPVHPLDGGRIVTAISPVLWVVGIPLMLIAVVKFFNVIIIMFLILGTVELYKYYKNPDKKYFEVEKSTRVMYALAYFGLISLLGLCSGYIYQMVPKNF